MLTGSIPASLGNLSNLQYLTLSENDLSRALPASLGNLSNLINLLLQDNILTGPIPGSFGSLSNVQLLRLDENQLTGNIPIEFGNLMTLSTLLLSDNLLTGEIPSELANLSNLQFLNISINNLTGCYHPDLSVLCTQLNFPTNANISGSNSFDADWEDLCMNGVGSCPVNTAVSLDIWVYDYNANTYDIIPGVPYDDAIPRFYTDHEVAGNAVEILDNSVPTTLTDDLV